MRRASILVMLALPFAFATAARAQTAVTVTLSQQGQALATQLGTSASDLASKIQDQIDTEYGTANVNKFLRSFANATTFAQSGLGVDYMSLPGSFIFGLGGQLALATDGDLDDKQSLGAGFAANFSVMHGLNLKAWDLPRWTVYVNGFYENGSTDRLNGAITTAGAHVQYRLVDPERDEGVGAAVARWTGVDVTTGIEFTRWSFGANDTISNDYTVAAGNGSTNLTVDSTGEFKLSSNALTVPIEVTTGIRLVELISLYIGAGFDITGGKATVDANLDGTMKTSDGTNIGTVAITGTGSNTASPGNFRGLAGVQLNIWALKIFAQANVSPDPAASLAFGVRLVL